jgi:hypothetical protein
MSKEWLFKAMIAICAAAKREWVDSMALRGKSIAASTAGQACAVLLLRQLAAMLRCCQQQTFCGTSSRYQH